MRGLLLVTLLGLVAVGTASSSYVAFTRVMDGRTNTCEMSEEPKGLDELASMLHRARLRSH